MLKINSQRLMDDLKHLRTIGKFGTGVVRPAFSPPDMQARRWLIDRMRAAGLKATMDGIGNVFGRSQNPGKAVLIGSHTDTQPQGGWLDGSLGVMYGLEVARAFAEYPSTARFAVDVGSWSDEEGTYMGLLGSRSFCGVLNRDEMAKAQNHQTAQSLSAALEQAELAGIPTLRLDPSRYAAYLEAHVEQGPHLDTQRLLLGVVSAIVGIRTFRVCFKGQQNHAGTTPMAYRRDAGAALIELAHLINAEFLTLAGPRTVWTIGHVRLEPGSPSVVPGRAEMLLQFRDTDNKILNALEAAISRIAAAAHKKGPVAIDLEAVSPSSKPAAMDGAVQECLAAAAETHAPGKWIRMPSGAGHDAQVFAGILPAGMLFVPSIGGISHDIAEDTAEEDIVRGCRTLATAAAALLQKANSA
ncbi:MAG: hydantoinase/carbamoylase family amidase [Desulfobacterales bacterium]